MFARPPMITSCSFCVAACWREQRAADRVLHSVVHLGAAATAFPLPADLANDTHVGRVSVERVDAFIRDAARRLEEQAKRAPA